MILTQHNRVLNTGGHFFDQLSGVKEYCEQFPTQIITAHLNQIKFVLNDDMVVADTGQGLFPFSEHGFRSICSILKVPFTYLNKLVSNDLLLRNLNESPNLFQDEVHIYIHESDAKQKYISAVSSAEPVTYMRIAESIERSELFNNLDLTATEFTISNTALNAYYLTPIQVEFHQSSKLQLGLCITSSEGLDTPAEILPLIRVHYQDQHFDYIGKPFKRIRRVENSYIILLEDELNQLSDGMISEIVDEHIKLLTASFESLDISYLELKRLRSSVSSTYRFQDGVFDSKNVLDDLLPEYQSFRSQYKEDIKLKPSFEINNYLLPFYLPRFFTGFENHILTLEHPMFFDKQRRNVFRMLQYHADIFYALKN